VVLGALIVVLHEPAVFWIGVVGLVLGWSYHGPPLKLAYRGLGELDVLICYGPLLAVATYMLQRGAWSWAAFWLALPLGILIAAFLWVNEFPDYVADRSAAKKNLVVRLGRRAASRVLPWIYASAFAILVALAWSNRSMWLLLGLAALPPAAYASTKVWAEPETFYRSHPVQPAALISFVLYSIGVGIGVQLGGS
jgi:1,4-dihydroxy-2-naphthoate octaprenyltransferase